MDSNVTSMNMVDKNSIIFRSILDNIREGVYVTDRDRVITYWNKGAAEITGYKREDVMGSSCKHNILTHVDDHGKLLCDEGCPIERTISEGETVEVEAYLHHKSGYRLPVHIRTAPITDSEGNIVGACEVFTDISSKISTEKKLNELRKLAMLDPLTDLANRRYIDTYLQKRLEEASNTQLSVAIIFYDIDHFKGINDTYGHDVGDRVIKMVANTLIKSARTLDLVGRWGGEELIEVIPNATEEYLQLIAERNRMLVENSDLALGSELIRVTVSVGATLISDDDTMESLIKRADKLMYKSKNNGRNRTSFG